MIMGEPVPGASTRSLLRQPDGGFKVLNPEHDGFLGKDIPVGRLVMQLQIGAGYGYVHPFSVTEDKHIVPMEPHREENGRRLYLQPMDVIQGENWTYVEFPKNLIRMLWVKAGGQMFLTDVGIISQNGSFFRVYQQMYRTQMYRTATNKIVCPDFEGALAPTKKWPQLVEFLNQAYTELKDGLPRFADYKESAPTHRLQVPEGKGVVEFYHLLAQMGKIATTHEGAPVEAGVVPRHIERPSRLKYLIRGEVVTIGSLCPPQQGSKSEFKHFARHVEPIKPLK